MGAERRRSLAPRRRGRPRPDRLLRGCRLRGGRIRSRGRARGLRRDRHPPRRWGVDKRAVGPARLRSRRRRRDRLRVRHGGGRSSLPRPASVGRRGGGHLLRCHHAMGRPAPAGRQSRRRAPGPGHHPRGARGRGGDEPRTHPVDAERALRRLVPRRLHGVSCRRSRVPCPERIARCRRGSRAELRSRRDHLRRERLRGRCRSPHREDPEHRRVLRRSDAGGRVDRPGGCDTGCHRHRCVAASRRPRLPPRDRVVGDRADAADAGLHGGEGAHPLAVPRARPLPGPAGCGRSRQRASPARTRPVRRRSPGRDPGERRGDRPGHVRQSDLRPRGLRGRQRPAEEHADAPRQRQADAVGLGGIHRYRHRRHRHGIRSLPAHGTDRDLHRLRGSRARSRRRRTHSRTVHRRGRPQPPRRVEHADHRERLHRNR